VAFLADQRMAAILAGACIGEDVSRQTVRVAGSR
jgi:hypothetical protein